MRGLEPANRIAGLGPAQGELRAVLVAVGVARGELVHRAWLRAPIGSRASAVVVAGVPAQAGHGHEDVVGTRIDRDPLAFALLAPAVEVEAGEGHVEELPAAQRVADGTGAVVALVIPLGVSSTPEIRLVLDLVG